MMSAIGRERGWQPMRRADFDALRGPRGALLVGSPQEVVDKILFERELFGNERFLLQTSVGDLPHASAMKSIELLGTRVAPKLRAAVAGSRAAINIDATAAAGDRSTDEDDRS
jgi:alkanesulfonate monooxygenase SsuD/methylene tetrahydromethanopterin reductase-like flavin-dependent oxidoreductase (luciferase family)